MFFEPVTLQEVVKNLRSGAAVGHDGTCISVVKDCVDVVCEPSSTGQMDRPILFIYANRFKDIETGF